MERAHENVALPRVLHQSVEISSDVRIIIIGDVHGCADELQALLQACAYDHERDQLVFVGDLVNKGPKSCEVVRFVRESRALCVRGNHDDAALNALYSWKRGELVLEPSHPYAYVQQLTADDVEFLEQLPFTVSLPKQQAIAVHAGIVPGVSLMQQIPRDMYKMRALVPSEEEQHGAATKHWVAYEKAPKDRASHAWAKEWVGPPHVYFGHHASAGLQQEAHATGLDTGCCYGKALTACILPSKELVSVPAKEMYSDPNKSKKSPVETSANAETSS